MKSLSIEDPNSQEALAKKLDCVPSPLVREDKRMKHKIIHKALPVIFAILAIFLIPLVSWSASYYVDATNGNDSNSGLSASTAWKTIAKVNASRFNPGFRRLKNKLSPFLDCKMHSMNQHFQSSILKSPLGFDKSSQLW